ncbi:MAG TPA: deaminase [Armatimonadetes bacterium]|nr:deaminase [Armatimonadota bacterium]
MPAGGPSYVKPSWDQYFMAMAVLAASRATCERGRVGVALVRDKRLLATGYNGPVGGNPDCIGKTRCRQTADGGCAETAHAEQNAVAYAARYGVDLTNSTCYLSGFSPCLMCAKLLIQCGCRTVIFRKLYRDTMPLEFLAETGVEMFLYLGPTPQVTWDATATPASDPTSLELEMSLPDAWSLGKLTGSRRAVLRKYVSGASM